MIDYVAKEDQLKIEELGWSTFWDDENNSWMMAEHVTRKCRDCRGTGEIQADKNDAWSMEVCEECDGTGQMVINILWDDAITCEDYLSLSRQRWYLNKRYGTYKPASIEDYWQETPKRLTRRI